MRVPDSLYYDLLLKYDRVRSRQLKRKTEELSSGKSLLYPSDNPVDTTRVLRFKRFIGEIEQFNRNIDLARTNLENAETALNSAVQVLQEARVKIIEIMNTGTLNGEDAKVLANYFEKVKEFVIQQGNMKLGDSYIFGGVKTQESPFEPGTGEYKGETKETTVQVGKGVEVETNFSGLKYFGVNEESNKITVVEVLDEIINILNSGDLDKLHSETIKVKLDGWTDSKELKLLDAFDAGLSSMMEYRSVLGTKQEIINSLKVQNESISLHFRDLTSRLQDTDYASAIAEYEKAKTAYEALLAAIQQTKDLSLLKYYK